MLSLCQPKAPLLTEDPRPKGTRKKKHFIYLSNIPPLSGGTHLNWVLYWHLVVILLRADWFPQSWLMAVKSLSNLMKVWEKELLVPPTVQALYYSNKQQTHLRPLDGSKYIWGHCSLQGSLATTEVSTASLRILHLFTSGVIKTAMRKLSRNAFINILRFSARCSKPPQTTSN